MVSAPSDNDFTDVVDLPAGVTSNQFSRVCGHPPRRPNSCRHWLEMERCQATQTAVKWTRRQTNDAPPSSRYTGCCSAVCTLSLCGLTCRLDAVAAVWVVVLRAPPRVGQTTQGEAGRSVDVLIVGSLDDKAVHRRRRRTRPPPPSPRTVRTVNRTALFRIGLSLKDRLTG